MALPQVTFRYARAPGEEPVAGAVAWVLAMDGAPGEAGRAMARELIAAYLRVDVGAVELRPDAHGRPALVAERVPEAPLARTLDFSLAHAGGVLVVGITPAGRIGVDLELLDTPVEVAALARDHLTPVEQRRLAGLPAGEQLRAFLQCWTAKEALAKALGLGLRVGMEQIETAVAADGSLRLAALHGSAELVRGWELVQREVSVGGVRAVAAVALGTGATV
jgi:4'-phosphopantetheinyl transferase